MPTAQIDNPSSSHYVADWIEFHICVTGDSLSKAEVISFIESSSGSEPDSTFLDDIWCELERRLFLYGNNPPYVLKSREVLSVLDWHTMPEYLMCVILSIDGNAVAAAKTGKLFERLSCEAIKSYFGGEAIIYGFPKKQTVEEVSRQMNEKFCYNPPSNFKDRGVDIICWKPFGDNRKSQIAIIVQCAAGHNWNQKLLSIPLSAWRQYILWSDTLPIKGFTTPTIIEDAVFHDVVADAGLMFDRPRLYRSFVQNRIAADTSLKLDLKEWCQNRLDQ